jgi:hypothetical protein
MGEELVKLVVGSLFERPGGGIGAKKSIHLSVIRQTWMMRRNVFAREFPTGGCVPVGKLNCLQPPRRVISLEQKARPGTSGPALLRPLPPGSHSVLQTAESGRGQRDVSRKQQSCGHSTSTTKGLGWLPPYLSSLYGYAHTYCILYGYKTGKLPNK